jgi:hypothetical protein
VQDEADDSGFYEYDVPGDGGEAEAIEKWLEERRFKAQHLPRRVLFFDEAHGLTKDASSGLLKKVEEAPGDVVYIFATSEHHNLSDALAVPTGPTEGPTAPTWAGRQAFARCCEEPTARLRQRGRWSC